MANQRDAEIVIGADVSGVERAAQTAIDSWRNAGATIANSFTSVGRNIVASLSDVALAAGRINFASQHDQVKQFEQSSAHLAIAMGRDLESVRRQIEATGLEIGKRPEEVTRWAASVGKLTYNMGGAIESARAFAGLADKTGRSLEEYQGLAETFGRIGISGQQLVNVLGVMGAQAEKLGASGGIAAFADQVANLGDVLTHMSFARSGSMEALTGTMGVLGQGLNPAAASRVQQTAIGALTNDPMGWKRFLGRDITDEHGQVDAKQVPELLQEITKKVKRRYGKSAELVLENTFGFETGKALMHSDFSKVGALAGITPTPAVDQARKDYLATDAGKREVAASQLADSARSLMGASTALGKAADAIQKAAAHSPVTTGVVSGIAQAGIQAGLGALARGGSGGGSGGAAEAAPGLLGTLKKGAGKALSFLSPAAKIAAAGAAGYAVGTVIDETLGISDLISGTGTHSRIRRDDGQGTASRTEAMRDANAALRAANFGSADDAAAGRQALQSVAMRGEGNGMAELVQELRREGRDDVTANRIAAALLPALRNITVKIVNMSQNPITATANMSVDPSLSVSQQ